MATYNQGILGSFTGRVGNIVGTSWKGRHIMRARAATYSNPNTPLQQAQRMRFAVMGKFLRHVQGTIAVGYGAQDQKMTSFNSAMRDNLNEAVTGTYPDIKVDLSKVIVSKGTRDGLSDMVLTSTEPNTIAMTWDEFTMSGTSKATDKLHVIVAETATGNVVAEDNTVSRDDGMWEITLPSGYSGKEMTVLAFFAEDSTAPINHPSQVSNTARGTINVAS